MEVKAFPTTHIKAIGNEDAEGTFEALVSVFGNVDRYGDRVEPGAFAESLSKGLPAVVWSHRWEEPPIGAALEASETDEGLVVKGKLFVEENTRAREIYAAMKNLGGDGRPPLREFSFAYDILEAHWEVEDEDEFYSLQKLDLIEVGPCLKGVNDQTRLLGVKGLERVRPPKPGADEEKTETDELDADRAAARLKARDLLTVRASFPA